MSAKSMLKAGAHVPRLVAVTAAVVAACTSFAGSASVAAGEQLVAEAHPSAVAVTTQTDAAAGAETDGDLMVEIQLTVNDGPLIDPRDIADVQAGDALAYTYRVTNTGDSVVSSPVVKTVTFTGSGELGAMFCPTSPRTLAPEMGFACGRTYVVSDEDASLGDLVYTVVASGTLVSGDVTSSGDSGSAITVVSSQASVGAEVADSGDRGSLWMYLFPVLALIAALIAGAWYIRDGVKHRRRAQRRREAGRVQTNAADELVAFQQRRRLARLVPSASPATAGDDVAKGQEEGVRDSAG